VVLKTPPRNLILRYVRRPRFVKNCRATEEEVWRGEGTHINIHAFGEIQAHDLLVDTESNTRQAIPSNNI
jgi:hypothetical protein